MLRLQETRGFDRERLIQNNQSNPQQLELRKKKIVSAKKARISSYTIIQRFRVSTMVFVVVVFTN